MILLTGGTGFLGQIICNEIDRNYIKTLSRQNSDYLIDLKIEVPVFNDVFEMVIHSAGKAHEIPKNDRQGKVFYDVNVLGTENLLNGLEQAPSLPKAFIFISSVAVYGRQTGSLINEDTPLLALDAYGKSKIEAENIIQDWCKKNNVIFTILRLPLIAGPNPTGNLKAMINGIKKGYYFNIAGGKAKKSIVLAEDIAKIIPFAANIGGIYNLTDQYHPSFSELSHIIAEQMGKSQPFNIPVGVARYMAKVGDLMGSKAMNSGILKKMTSDLTFDDSKAQLLLGWKPTPVLNGLKII